jgi:hypothetical protein
LGELKNERYKQAQKNSLVVGCAIANLLLPESSDAKNGRDFWPSRRAVCLECFYLYKNLLKLIEKIKTQITFV